MFTVDRRIVWVLSKLRIVDTRAIICDMLPNVLIASL